MDMQQHPSGNRARPSISDWLGQDVELRLPRSWIVAGGIVFAVLLLIALD